MKKILLSILMLWAIGMAAQTHDGFANFQFYAQRNAELGLPAKGERRIVLMGNSITQGWPETHPEFFDQYPNLVGRGISGQTSYQFLLRFRQDVIDLQPAVVVINYGTNDIALNTGPYDENKTFENVVTMVDMARANNIKVVLASCLPAGGFGWRPEVKDAMQKIRSLNSRVEAYARANKIPYVDYFKAMVSQDGTEMNPAYAKDRPGVHPNVEGYKVMESLLVPVLRLKQKPKSNVPRVYDVENTAAGQKPMKFVPFEQLPEIKELLNPLLFANGKQVKNIGDWQRRRGEIAQMIQHYEIGQKPAVDKSQVKAQMKGDTLVVDVTVGDSTMRLTSVITYPKTGEAPYPLMIGTSHISLPAPLLRQYPLAMMTYNERQVNGYGQFMGNTDRTTYPFVHLYPELIDNGAYSEWAWGLSRLIDGLQLLGPEVTKIDTRHIGVTGCSYAGKMALFCGAFDERVALTIAQEPGGGGAAAWRVSHTMDEVEDLDRTDYHWFMESLKEQFHDDNVYRLPYDHHELCAMVCPRALLVLGNPDYKWLADESARQSMAAAKKVWNAFGIGDRVAVDIVGGHGHCQLPESQYGIVKSFIERFLMEK